MRENKKVYLCDPKKNKECGKTVCQRYCCYTTNKKARAGIWKHIKTYFNGVQVPPCR